MRSKGSSAVTGVGHPSRGHRRRSDSDSEDELTSDHTSGPDYDSAGDRDEINERILQALERLHQDMKSVISRLSTMEEAVLSQQVSCTNLIPSCYCSYQRLDTRTRRKSQFFIVLTLSSCFHAF